MSEFGEFFDPQPGVAEHFDQRSTQNVYLLTVGRMSDGGPGCSDEWSCRGLTSRRLLPRPSASAEELLGVGEGDGEFGVEGVGDSIERGEAGGDAAAFESGDG